MVKFINNVLEWRKIVVSELRINIIMNGYETNVMLREVNFRVVAGLKILTTETGQVFDYDHSDLAFFDVGFHALEVRSVEVCTAVTVIGIERYVGKSVFPGVFGQNILLISDTVALTGEHIIL